MPSELQRVAQGLVDCLNEIPQVVAALHRRAQTCREHAALVVQLSSGSASVAVQQLDAAAHACEAAAHYLDMAPPKARGWTEQMVGGIRTAEPAGGSTARRPDASGGSPPAAERRQNEDQDEPEANKAGKSAGAGDETSPEDGPPTPRISDKEARRLFGKLPIREDSGLSRPKTRGKWIDHDGVEQDLASAEDEESAAVRKFLADLNIGPDRGIIMSPTHVEIKFGMYMRRNGLKHETISINNFPCKGQWSCEKLLGYILPPGATLTVFGPAGFKQTYPLPPEQTEQP